jgi:hypothetical protein
MGILEYGNMGIWNMGIESVESVAPSSVLTGFERILSSLV